MNMELDYKGYEKYLFDIYKSKTIYPYGINYVFKFDNRLGASVVKNEMSYGHKQDLWEVAVIKFRGDSWNLYWSNTIDDVKGWLTNEEVKIELQRIQSIVTAGETEVFKSKEENTPWLKNMGYKLMVDDSELRIYKSRYEEEYIRFNKIHRTYDHYFISNEQKMVAQTDMWLHLSIDKEMRSMGWMKCW